MIPSYVQQLRCQINRIADLANAAAGEEIIAKVDVTSTVVDPSLVAASAACAAYVTSSYEATSLRTLGTHPQFTGAYDVAEKFADAASAKKLEVVFPILIVLFAALAEARGITTDACNFPVNLDGLYPLDTAVQGPDLIPMPAPQPAQHRPLSRRKKFSYVLFGGGASAALGLLGWALLQPTEHQSLIHRNP